MNQQRIQRMKNRTAREETALWAIEEAIRSAKAHGTALERSRALTDAVNALLAVIEQEVS